MASTVINYRYPLTGQTLVLTLRGDTASADPLNGSSGDTFSESGTEDGFYSATVTEALTGVHWWQVSLSGTVLDQGFVRIADDVGPYSLNEQIARTSEANSVMILADTDELQQNQGNWLTADTTGLATSENVSDAQSAIQLDIESLNDFNPATDVVARVTLVDTTTTNADMRGTNGANTTPPPSAASIASAVWSLANAIDGKTPAQALQYIAAVACGLIPDGAGTDTEEFLGLDESTARVRFTVDSSGNRTAVEYDPT